MMHKFIFSHIYETSISYENQKKKIDSISTLIFRNIVEIYLSHCLKNYWNENTNYLICESNNSILNKLYRSHFCQIFIYQLNRTEMTENVRLFRFTDWNNICLSLYHYYYVYTVRVLLIGMIRSSPISQKNPLIIIILQFGRAKSNFCNSERNSLKNSPLSRNRPKLHYRRVLQFHSLPSGRKIFEIRQNRITRSVYIAGEKKVVFVNRRYSEIKNTSWLFICSASQRFRMAWRQKKSN